MARRGAAAWRAPSPAHSPPPPRRRRYSAADYRERLYREIARRKAESRDPRAPASPASPASPVASATSPQAAISSSASAAAEGKLPAAGAGAVG